MITGVFRKGNWDLLGSILKQVKINIKESKEAYWKKLQSKLLQHNIRDVCSGMRKIG